MSTLNKNYTTEITTDYRIYKETLDNTYHTILNIDPSHILTIMIREYPYNKCNTKMEFRKNHFGYISANVVTTDPDHFGSNTYKMSFDENDLLYKTLGEIIEKCVYSKLEWSVMSVFNSEQRLVLGE